MIPQEIKDKEYEYKEMYKILEKHLKDDFYKTGQYHNKISDSMSEYASIVSAEKDKFINDLKMENMTHEYNQAEAERFRPEYERQLLEEKESRIKELEEALKKILDDNNNYSDIKLIASQALNKYKNQ